VLLYTKLESPAKNKHSSLLDHFVSYEKSAVNKAPAVYIFYGCGELVFQVSSVAIFMWQRLTDILLQFFSLSISTQIGFRF